MRSACDQRLCDVLLADHLGERVRGRHLRYRARVPQVTLRSTAQPAPRYRLLLTSSPAAPRPLAAEQLGRAGQPPWIKIVLSVGTKYREGDRIDALNALSTRSLSFVKSRRGLMRVAAVVVTGFAATVLVAPVPAHAADTTFTTRYTAQGWADHPDRGRRPLRCGDLICQDGSDPSQPTCGLTWTRIRPLRTPVGPSSAILPGPKWTGSACTSGDRARAGLTRPPRGAKRLRSQPRRPQRRPLPIAPTRSIRRSATNCMSRSPRTPWSRWPGRAAVLASSLPGHHLAVHATRSEDPTLRH